MIHRGPSRARARARRSRFLVTVLEVASRRCATARRARRNGAGPRSIVENAPSQFAMNRFDAWTTSGGWRCGRIIRRPNGCPFGRAVRPTLGSGTGRAASAGPVGRTRFGRGGRLYEAPAVSDSALSALSNAGVRLRRGSDSTVGDHVRPKSAPQLASGAGRPRAQRGAGTAPRGVG